MCLSGLIWIPTRAPVFSDGFSLGVRFDHRLVADNGGGQIHAPPSSSIAEFHLSMSRREACWSGGASRSNIRAGRRDRPTLEDQRYQNYNERIWA
jgi:hypothetical protein